ncbi:MAG: hypothetical protein AAGF60_10335 [Pseudomonadota bacterium]
MTEIGQALASIAIALFALTWLGNWALRLLFRVFGLSPPDAPADGASTPPPAGRIIGIFERLVIAAGLITGRWEVLAAVIALKSVARFKELESKDFAEYFLIGSLFSILWGVLVTAAWLSYDQAQGLGLRDAIRALYAAAP